MVSHCFLNVIVIHGLKQSNKHATINYTTLEHQFTNKIDVHTIILEKTAPLPFQNKNKEKS